MKGSEDRCGKGSTFCRIRSCTEFIEEAECCIGTLLYRTKDANDICHVRGEGRQILLDRLLVSDISIYIMEDGELASNLSGNMKTCLTH